MFPAALYPQPSEASLSWEECQPASLSGEECQSGMWTHSFMHGRKCCTDSWLAIDVYRRSS